MADPKMEIILAAKDASKQAFESVSRNVDNIGRSFSQLKTIIGGIAIGGAVASLRKALDFAEQGAAVEKQIKAFENLSGSVGANSQQIIDNLKKVSRGFVSEAEIVKSAGTAMMLGIPADKLTELMKIAEATARQTGQSVTEAFSDISIGVARQSKLILDNLGIIVDVEKANETYAKALGKTSSELTEAEKRQAFMNDVLRSGNDLVRRIGSSSGELDSINRLVASHANLWAEVTRNIASLVAKEIPAYVRAVEWATEKLKSMRQSMGESAQTDMQREIEMLRSLESKGMAQPGSAAAKQAEFARRFSTPSETMIEAERAFKEWQKPDLMAAWREREGQWVEYTDAEKKAMLEAQEKLRAEYKKAKDDSLQDFLRAPTGMVSYGAWEDDYEKLELLRQQLIKTGDAAKQFNMELYKKAAEGDTKRLEKEIPFLQKEGLDEQINDVVDSVKTGFDGMIELSERTAEAMQDNFSDLFFDAFTGKLKSIEDYAKAVFTSIQRAAADMAGQMAAEYLFGSMKSGQAGQGSTGLIGDFLALFTSSGGPEQLGQFARGGVFMPGGLQRFADGGVVSRPTLFKFASGAGLMGENGPEAIMPLKRLPGGRLGVESTAPSSNITVNVQAPRGRLDRASLSELQASIYTAMARSARRNT